VRRIDRLSFAVGVGLALAAAAAPAWADGETYRNAKHHFQVEFPEGWVAIPDDAAAEYARTVAQVMGRRMTYLAFYERADSAEHFAYPYAMIDFHGADTRFYREFESQMAKGFDEAKDTLQAGSDGLLSGIAFGTPVLEASKSRFWVRLQMEVAGTPVTGLSCMQMGSRGIAVLNCYAETADFTDHEAAFRAMADGIRFDAGFRHDPSARPGFFSTALGRIALFALAGAVLALLRRALSRRSARTPVVTAPAASFGGSSAPATGPRPPPWYTPRPPAAPRAPLPIPSREPQRS
jgi:hypothetical protein